jgi:hypothetical protein
VVFDLARYGQWQSRMLVPRLRFDTHGTGLPLALFSWGVAFDLKRRGRHAALTGHGISSAARRARANAGARSGAPGGSDGGPAPAAGNPHTCSGKSLVSELCAVPLPSSGRTHPAVRSTVGDPRLLTRCWPEHGKPGACLPGNPHVYLEMRAGYHRMITSRTLRGRFPLDLQFAEYFARVCFNPRSGAGNVACDENREMLRGP